MGYYKLAQQLNDPELEPELYTDTFEQFSGRLGSKGFEKKAMFARNTVIFLVQVSPGSYFYYLP